ncbi:MAG: divergent PAP2 family protein, partial [Leptolyngbyaceae cyanobacterium CAN_BIN12]|nr:divergent PAP2 family protein [Leptolyngbyaceae cyanobacterium CAN_BIN12]
MQDFSDILDNQVLVVAIAACLIAQVLKIPVELGTHG